MQSGLWKLSPRNGKVPSYDRFDANFFNLTKEEVEFCDPQERTTLELTYEAICDSGTPKHFCQFFFQPNFCAEIFEIFNQNLVGTNPESLKGSNTGCFVGCCFREEHENIDEIDKIPPPACLPTRVSKHFEFQGSALLH